MSAPAKPPLGLKPREIHERERGLDILAAMGRFVETGKPIPDDWITELEELFGAA